MQKQTLLFPTLEQLCSFAKTVHSGYFLNTTNLTLTGQFEALQANMAMELYGAALIETCDKVYSYDQVTTATATVQVR